MDRTRRNWKRLLKKHQPLQLIAACERKVRQTINKVVKKIA